MSINIGEIFLASESFTNIGINYTKIFQKLYLTGPCIRRLHISRLQDSAMLRWISTQAALATVSKEHPFKAICYLAVRAKGAMLLGYPSVMELRAACGIDRDKIC